MTPCIVVLAAGQGARFQAQAQAGQSKLLAPCPGLDGVERPVLAQTLRSLDGLPGERVLVTRPDRPEIAELGRLHGFQVILVPSPGMGDSLAAAVAAAPLAAGWLVVLGDMPFIRPDTYRQVSMAVHDQIICVPVAGQGYGHPVAFGSAFAAGLMGLSGDQGARRLFAGATVVEIAVVDPGIYCDIDLPSDLLRRL
ncbi:nucleotidyltransferase family protein [Pseudomonas sp. App30]|uniref:nucleotidyltransferase family protein n=1 Tax=Pseudomonas sp. App30 TaxID=3068990 RepID=UPI003A7F9220